MYKNELEIDVFRCIRALFRNWKLILILTVLFAIIGFVFTLEKESDEYTSNATVYSVSAGSYQDSLTGISVMKNYSEVCTSYKVCQRAALLMGVDGIDGKEIMDSIYVDDGRYNDKNNNTSLIKIYATSSNPDVAMKMAESVAKAFVMEIENIISEDTVKLLDEPYSVNQSYNASLAAWKKRIIFILGGFVIGCVVILFFEIFDRKTRTVRECTIRNELPIIGIIPDFKGKE